MELKVADETFSMEQAKQTIATYCFESEPTSPTPPPQTYGVPLEPWSRPLFGYRSYDCQRGSGEGVDIVDIVAPVLLNAPQGYGVALVSNLLAVAPIVNDVVARVPSHSTFWDLSSEEVESPAEDSPSWWLHRAWYLVESVPGCGRTKTHKLLHHAWPHLFPLIDNTTGPRLGENMWLRVHGDLNDYRQEFSELEQWFAAEAASQEGVSLTRLRLHDILLWWRVHYETSQSSGNAPPTLGTWSAWRWLSSTSRSATSPATPGG